MSNAIPAIAPVSAALRAYGASATPAASDFGAMVGQAARSSSPRCGRRK
ncbi:hypothetical protein ACFQU7_39865 [Pseudoroseomonas wenyumeiae]